MTPAGGQGWTGATVSPAIWQRGFVQTGRYVATKRLHLGQRGTARAMDCDRLSDATRGVTPTLASAGRVAAMLRR